MFHQSGLSCGDNTAERQTARELEDGQSPSDPLLFAEKPLLTQEAPCSVRGDGRHKYGLKQTQASDAHWA